MTQEDDGTIEARIRASIERDMADPEWVKHINESFDDMRHGRFYDSRITLLPIPRWAQNVLNYAWQRFTPRGRDVRATIMAYGATVEPLTVRPAGTHAPSTHGSSERSEDAKPRTSSSP